jgi:hypothetical protein
MLMNNKQKPKNRIKKFVNFFETVHFFQLFIFFLLIECNLIPIQNEETALNNILITGPRGSMLFLIKKSKQTKKERKKEQNL